MLYTEAPEDTGRTFVRSREGSCFQNPCLWNPSVYIYIYIYIYIYMYTQ